jgi:hypothetical protein
LRHGQAVFVTEIGDAVGHGRSAGRGPPAASDGVKSLPFAPILPSRRDLRQMGLWRPIFAKLSLRTGCARHCRHLYFLLNRLRVGRAAPDGPFAACVCAAACS